MAKYSYNSHHEHVCVSFWSQHYPDMVLYICINYWWYWAKQILMCYIILSIILPLESLYWLLHRFLYRGLIVIVLTLSSFSFGEDVWGGWSIQSLPGPPGPWRIWILGPCTGKWPGIISVSCAGPQKGFHNPRRKVLAPAGKRSAGRCVP